LIQFVAPPNTSVRGVSNYKFNREATPSDETELLAKLQSDFVTILSKIDGIADGVLLLIDEADKPPAEANLGLVCKLLTEELSRKGCERLCVGLSGLPNLIECLRSSHESSPRLFQTMTLKPLEWSERLYVVESGIATASKNNGFDIKVSEEAKLRLASLSEGYPHFLQEFAYAAFEQDTDNEISHKDVMDSLFKENGSFDQLGRKFFSHYYEIPKSEDYRKVLDTMANHFDGWVKRQDIITESGLKGVTVDNALRALKAKQVVIQSDAKVGEYKLPSASFSVWIKVRHTAAGG
jgi:hypothetical protein